jgi:hypothetical protein
MNWVTAPGFVGRERADLLHAGQYGQTGMGDLSACQRAGSGDP